MSSSFRLLRPFGGTCLLFSLLFGSLPVAFAQEEEVIEEIIVSARKIEEGIQKVPLAVQVLTAEALEDLNIEMFDHFAEQTPSMTFFGAGAGSPNGSQRPTLNVDFREPVYHQRLSSSWSIARKRFRKVLKTEEHFIQE